VSNPVSELVLIADSGTVERRIWKIYGAELSCRQKILRLATTSREDGRSAPAMNFLSEGRYIYSGMDEERG
jgi:hypothetical protein